MTITSSTKKSLSTFGIFLTLLITIQYLRVQQPISNLDVASYANELCTGVVDASGNFVTTAQINASSSFIQQVSVATPDFGVAYAINTRAFDMTKVQKGLIQTSAVWMIFLLLSIIGWLSYSCTCCFPNNCPCCSGCRRDVQETPYTKSELLVPSIFAIIFSLLVIAVGAAGISYAPGVATGIVSMRCSFMYALEQILLPTSVNISNGYPGIQGILDRLTNLKVLLGDLQTNTTNTFENKSQPIKDSSDQVIGNLTNYNTQITYNQNSQGAPVSTPSFYANSQSLFSFMTSNVQNFQAGSTAVQKFQTSLTPEARQMRIYYDVMLGLIYGIQNATQPFLVSQNFGALLDIAIAVGQNMTAGIQNQSTSIYIWTQPMQTYSSTITMGLQVIFAASIAFSVLIIVGTLILQICKKFSARGLVHLGWCFYSIFMILGFLLGTIMNPVGVISLEFCDYMNGFLNDQMFFTQSQIISDVQTKNILQECLHGKGDILSIMNLTPAIFALQNLVSGIGVFVNNLTSINITSKESYLLQSIANDTGVLTSISNGTVIDYDPSDNSASSIAQQIVAFNQIKGTNCKELAQVTCADGSTIPSTSSTSANCWHPSLLVSQNGFVFCTAQTSIAAKLKTWFNQQSQKWGAFVSNQQSSTSAHNGVDAQFQVYLNSIQTYVVNTNAFVQYNTNNSTGLIAGVNCLVMKSIFQQIYNAMCVLFVPAAFRATILILLLSLSMFFGSLSSFCVGLRFLKMSTIDTNNQIKPRQNEEEQSKLRDFHVQQHQEL